jgi:hypothetical protein
MDKVYLSERYRIFVRDENLNKVVGVVDTKPHSKHVMGRVRSHLYALQVKT